MLIVSVDGKQIHNVNTANAKLIVKGTFGEVITLTCVSGKETIELFTLSGKNIAAEENCNFVRLELVQRYIMNLFIDSFANNHNRINLFDKVELSSTWVDHAANPISIKFIGNIYGNYSIENIRDELHLS